MDTAATATTDGNEDEWVPDLTEEIIQVFEDFLWVHNGKIHNPEPKPDAWMQDDIIYGKQKEELSNDLFALLLSWQLI